MIYSLVILLKLLSLVGYRMDKHVKELESDTSK